MSDAARLGALLPSPAPMATMTPHLRIDRAAGFVPGCRRLLVGAA